jgi:hypothetical protein
MLARWHSRFPVMAALNDLCESSPIYSPTGFLSGSRTQ